MPYKPLLNLETSRFREHHLDLEVWFSHRMQTFFPTTYTLLSTLKMLLLQMLFQASRSLMDWISSHPNGHLEFSYVSSTKKTRYK